MGCGCREKRQAAMVASANQQWIVTKSNGDVLVFDDFGAAQAEATDSGGVLAAR